MNVLYLYLNPRPRDRIQEQTLAGIRRFAETCGWHAVPWHDARPETLSEVLSKFAPVAGCVVECSDDNGTLPLRLFGRIPVVYLHAAPSLYGRRVAHVEVDNDAVAAAAFRELSAGLPYAYAFVGDYRNFSWSRVRARAFRRFAEDAGSRCVVFPNAGGLDGRARRLEKWLSSLQRRTAVLAANDFTAAEVVSAAHKIHRAIPSELTLCGVDNLGEVCEGTSPTITSIQVDFEREGYLAAKMACSRTLGSVAVGPLMAVWRESTLGSRRGAPNILSAVERIRREACDGLTARDVIAASPGSRSLFNLRFREATGHSVHDEIEHVRLEKAFTLLAQTDTAIGVIAGLCGYRSNIALHKAFRLRTGMSMRDWRLLNRQ